MFVFLWIWIGIVIIVVIMSSIIVLFMSMVFKLERMIYGIKVMNINRYNGKLLRLLLVVNIG